MILYHTPVDSIIRKFVIYVKNSNQ